MAFCVVGTAGRVTFGTCRAWKWLHWCLCTQVVKLSFWNIIACDNYCSRCVNGKIWVYTVVAVLLATTQVLCPKAGSVRHSLSFSLHWTFTLPPYLQSTPSELWWLSGEQGEITGLLVQYWKLLLHSVLCTHIISSSYRSNRFVFVSLGSLHCA